MIGPNSAFNRNLRGSPGEHIQGINTLGNLTGLSNIGMPFGNDLLSGMNSYSNGNQFGEGTKNSNDPGNLFYENKYQ